MKYILKISEPCHENWQRMNATEKGRFCNSCKKEVFDFTQTSFSDLSRVLSSGDQLCGRFRPDQLNREIMVTKDSGILKKGIIVAAVALLAGTPLAVAQTTTPKATFMGRYAKHYETPPKSVVEKSLHLRGTVRDEEGTIGHVLIRVKNAGLHTYSDAKGRFSLKIPYTLEKDPIILQVVHDDYELSEITVTDTAQSISVMLYSPHMVMGDIDVQEILTPRERLGRAVKKANKS